MAQLIWIRFVYVILTRIISLQVQSFAFLCIPSLHRYDFHISTWEDILCSLISRLPKTFENIFTPFLCYSFKAFRWAATVSMRLFCCKCTILARLWNCVKYSLPLLRRLFRFFFLQASEFSFLLRELLLADCSLLSAILLIAHGTV